MNDLVVRRGLQIKISAPNKFLLFKKIQTLYVLKHYIALLDEFFFKARYHVYQPAAIQTTPK
jgi:hypothetical protein